MRTILLIDDESGMGDLVGMFVEDLDARVVQATSFSSGRRVAVDEVPDVIMLDLNLGDDGDGLDRLPELEQESVLADVPIIVFSVHSSREREARRRGASGFVPKPFKAEALRSELQRFLK